jgi:cardiolipin synthase
MRLIIQPDHGAQPIIEAIDAARDTIDLYLFRLDHPRVEDAIERAIDRGIAVRALVAHVNSGGKRPLRKLELQLLGMGVAVSRSDDDLMRYHGKLMIVDRKLAFILGYNFTRSDMEETRSLGIATESKEIVEAALSLFESDFERKTFLPPLEDLVVSPLNSRPVLLSLIEGAKEKLLIYDSRFTDSLMRRAVMKRARAGVEVRIIGRMKKQEPPVMVQEREASTLHVRAIVQDDNCVFIGSQSMRRVALERRREIGLIVRERDIVAAVGRIFENDWQEGQSADRSGEQPLTAVA